MIKALSIEPSVRICGFGRAALLALAVHAVSALADAKSFRQAACDGDIGRVRAALALGTNPNQDAALVCAAYSAEGDGGVEVVKALLEAGADVNGVDNVSTSASFGQTALMATIARSTIYGHRRDVFDILLNHPKIDVNVLSATGWTALSTASKTLDNEYIQALLNHGADVRIGPNGYDALCALVAHPQSPVSLIDLYVAKGAALDWDLSRSPHSAFSSAILSGNAEAVAHLFALGGKIIGDEPRRWALAWSSAGEWRNVRILETLLANGLSPADLKGLADLPARNDDTETLAPLLRAGAYIGENHFGDSPLKIAVRANAFKSVQLLVAAEASTAGTVVEAVRKNSDPRILEFLLASGADPNSPDHFGTTFPLFRAVYEGTPQMVEALLSAGADPEYVTPTLRESVLFAFDCHVHAAECKPRLDADSERKMELLKKFTLPFSALDHQGLTVLMKRLEYPALVRAFIAAGADVHDVSRDGRTALHVLAGLGVSDSFGAEEDLRSLEQTIGLLVGAGLSLHDRDSTGHEPIDYATDPKMRDLLQRMALSQWTEPTSKR